MLINNMIESSEYKTQSTSTENGKFKRSEEIECQLGHYVEINRQYFRKRCSIQHDNFHQIRTTSESSEPIHKKHSEVEFYNNSSETSIIYFSELYSLTGTSWFSAVIIMANCTIGMGLLNFPYAILCAGGILSGMTVQIIIIALIIISLTMTCYASQYYGDVTFQGVIGSHCGKISKEICRLLIFLNNFGALIVNLIVIGDQFEHIGKTYNATLPSFITSRVFWVPIISVLFIFPLCFLKNFEFFKYSSFIGVICAVYMSFGLTLPKFISLNNTKWIPVQKVSDFDFVKIIPLICFAFECHIEIPPMIACLKQQSFIYYEKMIVGYVILSGLIYSVSGILGFLTFGQGTPDDIIMGYELKDPLVIIAMILITLKIVTTYPIIFYCLRIVIEDYFKICMKYRNQNCWDRAIHYSITVILFSTSVLIAIFIPNITKIINLIGGISAVFIFIFPGLCFLKLFSSSSRKWKWSMISLGSIFICFGVFIAGMSTTQSIMEYIY